MNVLENFKDLLKLLKERFNIQSLIGQGKEILYVNEFKERISLKSNSQLELIKYIITQKKLTQAYFILSKT